MGTLSRDVDPTVLVLSRTERRYRQSLHWAAGGAGAGGVMTVIGAAGPIPGLLAAGGSLLAATISGLGLAEAQRARRYRRHLWQLTERQLRARLSSLRQAAPSGVVGLATADRSREG
jgi:hypothetical protein